MQKNIDLTKNGLELYGLLSSMMDLFIHIMIENDCATQITSILSYSAYLALITIYREVTALQIYQIVSKVIDIIIRISQLSKSCFKYDGLNLLNLEQYKYPTIGKYGLDTLITSYQSYEDLVFNRSDSTLFGGMELGFGVPAPPTDTNLTNTVWAVCFRPDGVEVLIAVADRIFIYDANTGDLVKQLRGHKDSVYCIAYSKDSQKFATGGADNSVVIWSPTGEGLLKYTHNDKIQCLAFNPVLQNLASCSGIDFGLWQSDQQNVNKQKVPAKVLCCDWSPDGQLLALGLISGVILIKDKVGTELMSINKTTQPVWTLAFCPQKFDTSDNLLVAGSWDSKLSLYSISGGKQYKQLGNDKELGFDPCSISFYPTGEYMVISGSDKKITLWNKEGVLLGTIGEMKSWVWGTAVNPISKMVFAGSNDGAIVMNQVEFQTIHGLYQDRYAYREFMTDVIIQHLVTETRVKIRCRDYIKKIAIYKDRLAVQLPEKIIIYSVSDEDPYDMKYKAYKKINKKIDCNLLFVVSQHLVLVFEKKIQLLSFSGILEREWILDSTIRYVKTISGPPKREGLLVGLKNGSVMKIFIDNGFPISLVKQTTPIKVVDISADRQKIAVIDDYNSLFVYDIKSQQLLFQEVNVYSIAWNLEMEDMIAYTGQDTLFIKTREMPPSQQRLPGYVVGFKGSKIFCLHSTSMNTIDVPQSSTFYRFLEKKDFMMAYKIACIGVTEQDWRALGIESLLAKNFQLARKAFVRIRDLKFIDLCDLAEQMNNMRTLNENWLFGEILAYQGKYKEAAQHYIKNGLSEKAIDLYTSMKKFNEANDLLRKFGNKKAGEGLMLDPVILIKQAEYERDSGNWKEAADLFQQAKKHKEAIDIYGKRGNLDAIMDVCKNLDKSKNKTDIELCAKYFRQARHHTFAKQAYLMLGDIKALMALHVELHKWDEAQMLARQNTELESMIYLPYADWLSANDRFDEAQEAYKKAGRPDLSLRIVEFLTYNAVIEKRFQDAAQYYWMLAAESLQLIKEVGTKAQKQDKKYQSNFEEYMRLAEIYQSYQLIHKFIEESYQAVIQGALFNEAIFNAARFLVSNIGKRQPLGINKVYIYYALSFLGFKFEAFKTARFGYERLQTLKIPVSWQDDIDLANLKVRAKPFSDKEGFQLICNRCMTSNALVNSNGDFCTACGHPFIRNFVGFDTLPLVEFVPKSDIPFKKVLEFLKMDPPEEFVQIPKQQAPKKKNKNGDGWQENNFGEEQTLTFQNPDINEDLENDLFTQRMLEWLESQVSPESYKPVEVDERILKMMRYEEIYIVDYSQLCPNYPRRYFKNMVPDVAITLCERCCKFFLQDEYEFAYMERGFCPFCKNIEKDKGGKNVYGSLADIHR